MFLVGFGAAVALFSANVAQAGCWVVWQGLKSHVECDSSGATPTFKDFNRTMNEIAGLSPKCKRSVISFAGSYLSCGYAVMSAIQTGGVTVWVGAGEPCYKFTKELETAGDACKEYVNLRTKPIQAKVCNGRSEKINVSIGRREVREKKVTSGWFPLNQGECKTFSYADARVIYAMALTPNGGTIYPNFNTNDLDDNATFCINRAFKHDNLDVGICHGVKDGSSYDYKKPGNLKFTKFGRISGLKNGFTFR